MAGDTDSEIGGFIFYDREGNKILDTGTHSFKI